MKLVVTYYQDEDGWYIIECPAIPGCISQGQTREEALANIRDAAAGCLAARRDAGLPLTIDTMEIEVA